MASFNKVILMGNLTRDPQLKYLPSQTAVVEFGLACNRKFKTQAGEDKEEVTFVGAPMLSREAALAVMRAFLVPEDMGTPAGAVALRGATNFQTPSGWDTVYSPILNMIERPVAPMLAIRVETDWYAHETEFRYVLQAGEGITIEHSIPIGQVFFVPRESITMRPCTSDEIKAIEESRQEFNTHKAEATQKTSYGLSYSPHYLRQSRAQKE